MSSRNRNSIGHGYDSELSGDENNPFPKHQQKKLTMKPPTSPGGYLEFRDNRPIMHYNKPPEGMICKHNIVTKFYEVLSKPYDGRIYDPVTQSWIDDPRPEMQGRQCIDVLLENTMQGALLGDFEKVRFLIEHTKGKPIQENNNVNIDATQTYREFLEQLASEEDIGDDAIDTEYSVSQNYDDEYDELLDDL